MALCGQCCRCELVDSFPGGKSTGLSSSALLY